MEHTRRSTDRKELPLKTLERRHFYSRNIQCQLALNSDVILLNLDPGYLVVVLHDRCRFSIRLVSGSFR